MKKFLLLTQADSHDYSVRRLAEEAGKMNLQFKHIKYTEINIDFGTGCRLFTKDITNIIEEFDCFILRSSATKYGSRYIHFAGLIKYLVDLAGKTNFNYEFSRNHSSIASKIHNYAVMASNDIPVIKTLIFPTVKDFIESKDTLEFPLIFKKSSSSHGEGVVLIDDFNEAIDYFQNNEIQTTLIQEFIDSNEDYRYDVRVITVGDEILGGYKRVTGKDKLVTNMAQGAHAEEYEMTQEVEEIVRKIMQVFKAEFTGIDIMFKDGKPLILEVNNSPQFKGFEEATGVNVAKYIINYMLSSNERSITI